MSHALRREANEGMEVQLLAVKTSALDGYECSVSLPGRSTPVTHWMGGSVGPRAELDDVVETRKASSLVRSRICSLYRLRNPSDKTVWDNGGTHCSLSGV